MLMAAKQMALRKYLEDAETWDHELYVDVVRSRDRARLIAGASLLIAMLAVATTMILLPLKTYQPYVVTVDKSTGYAEVTKGLYEGKLTQDDAVTESNLVRYISTRESYNPSVLRESYNTVSLMSVGNALKEFQQLWDGQNPDNPSVKMGKQAAVDIKIKSVSLLNDRTASVRFSREYRDSSQVKVSDWNAILDFQYVQKPMRMEDRFLNPLGFQVTSYRVNPEAMEK
jgi:type IV secretion system protein VirB8